MALIISKAHDTNGGNARFVRASQKLSAMAFGKTDPAGVVGRFAEAAEGSALTIRSAHQSHPYMQFPHDMTWGRTPCPEHGTTCRVSDQDLMRMAQDADVIHLNNSYAAYQRFRLKKPALLHHHGSLFRKDPAHMLEIAKGYRMVQAVSTIDLQRPAPELLHWLPSPYDIDELQAFGKAHRREPDGRIRIVHSPTSRELKHTAVFEAAVATLQAEGLPVDSVIVEGRPWSEVMAIKATADIVFDQLLYGYGCNSIEAWGMGIPVVSGADEWTLGRMANEWAAVPFEEANERTLVDVLRAMVTSAELREDAAQRGLAHVRKYHDEAPALARLAELYDKAIETYQQQRIPGKGAVTFRSKTGKPLLDGEDRVTFVDGMAQVSDPYVIKRLRYLASRSTFGIEEVA